MTSLEISIDVLRAVPETELIQLLKWSKGHSDYPAFRGWVSQWVTIELQSRLSEQHEPSMLALPDSLSNAEVAEFLKAATVLTLIDNQPLPMQKLVGQVLSRCCVVAVMRLARLESQELDSRLRKLELELELAELKESLSKESPQ